MTGQSRPEPFISANALLFFLLPTLGMIVVLGGAIAQIFVQGGWLLPFALLCLVAPIMYLALGQQPSPTSDRRRYIFVWITLAMLVLGLTIRQIAIRGHAPQPQGMYDGAIQSEVAARMLLDGKNPYVGDYRGTEYASVNQVVPGGSTDNVVWYHYIYPPLTFLAYVPLAMLDTVLGPLADYRLITVGALFLVTILLTRQAKTFSRKITVVILTLGNPLLWGYAIIGANDILGPLLLLIATILIGRRRWLFAGIVFGLALAVKQTVWFIAPLWLFWVWRSMVIENQIRTVLPKHLLGILFGVAITFGPFLIWDTGRIFTDLVPYAAGNIPNTYPISGTTFLQYLHVLRLIPSAWSIVPTYLFQLMVGIPMLALTIFWLRRSAATSRWLIGAAIVPLAILLVSRYFNNNFLTFPAALLVAAYIFQLQEKGQTYVNVE